MQVNAVSAEAHIEVKLPLGQPALLQLLTATSVEALRPLHGHITKVAMNGSNGGFAHYTLTIEPWTAFLAHGSDSRIFQDMTVFVIVEAVFDAWQGKGGWRHHGGWTSRTSRSIPAAASPSNIGHDQLLKSIS